MNSPESLIVLFGRIVAEHRARLGISQERLAGNAELDRTSIGKLEKGRHSPSLASLFKLARGLRVNPDDPVRELRERHGVEREQAPGG